MYDAKADRAKHRMCEKAREYQIATYSRKFVAPIFQRMIRAEAAAKPDDTCPAIVGCELTRIHRRVGEVVCVTCGKVAPWAGGIGGMHTGHFIAGRGFSILFEENNVAPQCSSCNYARSGEQQIFRKWMIDVRGRAIVERLERLKNEVRQLTREELVDRRIEYQARLDAATATIDGSDG